MSRRDRCLFSGLIASLSLALDLEENRKLYHAWRVALLSWPMAKKICPAEASMVFYGALLHDIGAMGMEDHIVHAVLKKTGDKKEVFLHPEKGAKIIKSIPALAPASDYVLQHHEKWNGSGYPKGLKGSEISKGAQIIAIADLFDVMLRRVGNKYPLGSIIYRMEKLRGEFFSPEIFGVFKEVLTKEFYEKIRQDDNLEAAMKEILYEVPPPPQEKMNGQISTTSALAGIIDAKHKYTAGHSERVALYALRIGVEMGLTEGELEKLHRAALLHDLGKIAVPRSILDKPGRLTKDEFEIIKKHPQGTIDILSMVDVFKDVAYIAGGHHERVDGKGYPLGLSGSSIPQMAKILAAADALDAMTSNRPYQPTRSMNDALKILQKNRGTQFDKIVVEAAISALADVNLYDIKG